MFKKILSKAEQTAAAVIAKRGALTCPQCRAPSQAVPQSFRESLTCGACGHVAAVTDWAKPAHSGDPIAVGPVEQPVSTKITSEEFLGTRIWNIPPSGRAGGLLVFGWLWSGFVGLMAGLVLWSGITGSGTINDRPATLSGALGFLMFMIPFMAVGAGMLFFAYRMKKTSHRVEIGDGKFTLTRQWLGRKVKSLPLESLTSISQVSFYTQNYTPVYGIEIKGSQGKIRFGSSLRDEEKAWLVSDFKHAVWPEAAREEVELAKQAALPLAQGDGTFAIPLPPPMGLKTVGISMIIGGLIFFTIGWFVIPHDIHTGFDHASGTPVFFRILDYLFNFMDHAFNVIWSVISLSILAGGVFLVRKVAREQDVERKLIGTARDIILRKSQQATVLEEKSYPRESVRDVRLNKQGEVNGQPRFKVELVTATKVEKLAGWIDHEAAEKLVGEVKRAMGS